MHEIGIDGMHQLLLDGHRAVQYAWDHYEELAARKHTYTLYGPYAYNIGASIPSSMTPTRARKLLKTTHRKDYLIYHLDNDYKVIRTIVMLNYTKVEHTYHHFELDGVTYACPFRGTEKILPVNGHIESLKFSNGKPDFFGVRYCNFVFAQFYKYIDTDKMLVSTYRYFPFAKYNMNSYPIDPNAPVGALNSSIDRHCREEVPGDTDFSRWLK